LPVTFRQISRTFRSSESTVCRQKQTRWRCRGSVGEAAAFDPSGDSSNFHRVVDHDELDFEARSSYLAVLTAVIIGIALHSIHTSGGFN
jgi:hypothetical protein